jgi:hypothetical protein
VYWRKYALGLGLLPCRCRMALHFHHKSWILKTNELLCNSALGPGKMLKSPTARLGLQLAEAVD